MKAHPFSAGQTGEEVNPKGILAVARRLLYDSAEAWGLSPTAVFLIGVLPIFVAMVGVILALTSKELYVLFTREDGIAEDLQVTLYVFSLLLCLRITWRRWQAGERLIAFLYLGLNLGFIFLIGEEISWGQRIFGWQTTATLAEVNRQGETNLHNINGVEGAFRWVELLMGLFGTLLPILLARWTPTLRWQKLSSAIIPHYSLVPYFFMLLPWRFYRIFLEHPEKHRFAIAEYSEVIELIIALAFFFFLVFQVRKLNRAKAGPPIASIMAERSTRPRKG